MLKSLEIEHFRCVQHAQMDFAATSNVLVGPNGAGKTSILEAIFLLGAGHSFRSNAVDALIQNATTDLLVVGKFAEGARDFTIGVRCSPTARECRVNGELAKSAADLAKCFPVQVIDPEVHRLLEDGPAKRRKFLDWGLFHVEQSFHNVWSRFNRTLKQRNAELKISSTARLDIWDQDLAKYGELITEQRKKYLAALDPYLDALAEKLLGEKIHLEYLQGWRKGVSLSEALDESRLRDRSRRTTSVGPHRADISIKIGGHPAKDRVSRGQQKMVACSMLLAQQNHCASLSLRPTCLLLDDPGAELDVENLNRLLTIISTLPAQIIATSLNTLDLSIFKSAKKFHVEHGFVKAMA